MKRIILFLLAIMLLIPMAVSCAPKDDTKTSGLGYEMKRLVKHDGWIYYSLFENGDLYKIRPDGKEKTKVGDIKAISFEIYEDRIYYANKDNDNNVYSAKLDGSDIERLADENWMAWTSYNDQETGARRIVIADGWVYCLSINGILRRVRPDGTEGKIYGWCKGFSANEDWLYWISMDEQEGIGWHLIRMKPDGTEKTQFKHIESCQVDYDDDWIYYGDFKEGGMYKQSYDGSQVIKLTDNIITGIFKLTVIGDWIYYHIIGDERGIYKVSKDGSENIKLTDDTSVLLFLDVWDNWLIYVGSDAIETYYMGMLRVSNTYKTDKIIDEIMTEMLPANIKVRKYE